MNEAGHVGTSAAQRAGEVTGVIGEQAKQVASETGTQARNLLDEGVHQIRGQASDGQQKLAQNLRGVADQLRRMSEHTDDSGIASDLIRQATDRTEQVASWLAAREPGDLLDEARRFARRRPGVFLLGAAVAGVLAGRLTRNIVAANQDSTGKDSLGKDSAGERAGGPVADGRRNGSTDEPWQTQRPDAAMTTPLPTGAPAPAPAPGIPGSRPQGAVPPAPPVTPGPAVPPIEPPVMPPAPPAPSRNVPGSGPVR